MELSDKEIKSMLIGYYKTFNKLDELSKDIAKWDKELEDILESLALTSQQLSDMPKGKGNTYNPVENILKEYEKIKEIYKNKAADTRKELQETLRRQSALKKWIDTAELTDTEKEVIRYMYRDGLRDWKIGQLIGYDARTVRRKKQGALKKLSVNVRNYMLY